MKASRQTWITIAVLAMLAIVLFFTQKDAASPLGISATKGALEQALTTTKATSTATKAKPSATKKPSATVTTATRKATSTKKPTATPTGRRTIKPTIRPTPTRTPVRTLKPTSTPTARLTARPQTQTLRPTARPRTQTPRPTVRPQTQTPRPTVRPQTQTPRPTVRPQTQTTTPTVRPSVAPKVAGVPQKAYDVLEYVLSHDGDPPSGYQGGVVFQNRERILPRGVSYREYDVNPLVPGRNRGAERLVVGADGTAWYTSDHYDSFKQIR